MDQTQMMMTLMRNQLALMEAQHGSGSASPVSVAKTAGYLHGSPEALFGDCGLEQPVISLLVEGAGFASKIPVVRTNERNPIQAYISGFNPSGNNFSDIDCGECADAPTVGDFSTCKRARQWGCYKWKTKQLNIREMGIRYNRGEYTDLTLANSPLLGTFENIFPRTMPNAARRFLANDLVVSIQALGIEAQNVISRDFWRGTGMNNQFAGLEQLISDSQPDINGIDCVQLHSQICDVEKACISSPAGATIVYEQLRAAFRKVRSTASRQQMGNVRWVLVMREQMLEALAQFWPYMYYAQAAGSHLGATVNIDGAQIRNMSDDMINNRYITIDGTRVEVCVDDFMPVEYGVDANGQQIQGEQVSDIYLIPMTVRGNQNAIQWEVFDWRNALEFTRGFRGFANEFWTDRGYYLWLPKHDTNGCLCYQVEIKPRLHLRVPQLAARIQDVCLLIDKPYAPVDFSDPFYGQN